MVKETDEYGRVELKKKKKKNPSYLDGSSILGETSFIALLLILKFPST